MLESVGFFMMHYYVYILQSDFDDSYYIGYSQNPGKRLEDHNDGRSRYTKNKRPWIIVYQEEFQEKSDAIKRERFLKQQRNRSFYKSLIQNNK